MNLFTRKLGILYISHERKMGGANYSLFELAVEMQERGHNVYVLILYPGCPIDCELKRAGIKTIYCPFGWWEQPQNWNILLKLLFRLLHWTQSISSIFLARLVKKYHIDIVHSNSSVIDIGGQVAKKAHCYHVWHFREFGQLHYNFEYLRGKDYSMEFMNKNASIVIFISDALRNAYPEIKNSIRIYNGISEKCFIDDKHYFTEGRHVNFLVTGVLSEGKNQKLVLEAVKILMGKDSIYHVSSQDYEVFFAGQATALAESKNYEAKLRRVVTECDMGNVHFLGYVKDMIGLREKMSVEIVTSNFEAYGRVSIEAMAAHNLVLASNSGANIEIVETDNRGVIFSENDAIDLAVKMKWCIENPVSCEKIVENAYLYAKEYHSAVKNQMELERVYLELMEKNNG